MILDSISGLLRRRAGQWPEAESRTKEVMDPKSTSSGKQARRNNSCERRVEKGVSLEQSQALTRKEKVILRKDMKIKMVLLM